MTVKQLSEKTREKLRPNYRTTAISFAITHDKTNILNLSIKATQESILKLNPRLESIYYKNKHPLIPNDGIKGKIITATEIETLNSIPNTSITKRDSKFRNIAISALTKIYRG